jgi:tetratricopeptide (TPR) repeat protein
MKKVVLASLLACVTIASGLPFASAQGAPSAAQAAPAAAANPCSAPQMAAAEYAVYNNAMTQTDPKAKAAALEQYLTQFPQSAVNETVLETVMALYSTFDAAKTLDAADRLLKVNPNSVKGLYAEALIRKSQADAVTDPAAKQAALDTAASFAQKGLAAPKPACMSDADFTTLKSTEYPSFYSVIGYAAFVKKDSATAIDAYKKELASVPEAQTHALPVLPDIYQLSLVYLQSAPPDYLNCAFYAARFTVFAPEPYKSQVAATAKYCYKKYHGADDGYDAVLAAATASLNPPADFASTVKAAPTPAEQIHGIITGTPDLGTLAVSDKEMVFQYGSPEDAAKVWDTIKGKSYQLDGVVIAATPTQIQLAVSDDAKQAKTADFTINLAPADDTAKQTALQAKAKAAAIAAATVVGQTVSVSGTYDSFTPTPIMITMKDGEVILSKSATKPAPKPATTVHHPAAAKKK